MATKREIMDLKSPKIELIEKKDELLKERKKLTKTLMWILILSIISLILETLFLVSRL